mgnify:FL=1
MMQDDNLTCEDYYIESRPTTSSRVFHWEHLAPEAQDIIKDTINESIERELPKHIHAGDDIVDAEVTIQVPIHTQIVEY